MFGEDKNQKRRKKIGINTLKVAVVSGMYMIKYVVISMK
jgi:hypothetical protein